LKIYDFPFAPNPRKLRTYLAEKGLEVDFEVLNLREGEQRSPAHLARNPMGNVPVLELDDGSFLTESLAIIEYFEELHPEPPMIGTTPIERARVRRLERIAELGVLGRVGQLVHATRSPLPERAPNPALAEAMREQLPLPLRTLDAEVGAGPFVAGERPSIADCTLFAAREFARFAEIDLFDEYPNLQGWHERFSQRPSTRL